MTQRVIFALSADVAGGVTRHWPGYVGGSGIEGFRIAAINSDAIAHDRNCNNLIRGATAAGAVVTRYKSELAGPMICFASRLIDDLCFFCSRFSSLEVAAAEILGEYDCILLTGWRSCAVVYK